MTICCKWLAQNILILTRIKPNDYVIHEKKYNENSNKLEHSLVYSVDCIINIKESNLNLENWGTYIKPILGSDAYLYNVTIFQLQTSWKVKQLITS